MGLLGNAFNGVLRYRRLQIVGDFIYKHAIDPFMAKYVDGLNVEEKVQEHFDERFNPDDHTQEELDAYEQTGKDLATFAENVSKYGDTLADDNSFKASMLRMAGRVGEVAKDNPVAAGSYLQGNTLVSDQLITAVQYVNEKVQEAEKENLAITSDTLVTWGKEGFMQSAIKTAADIGGKAVAAAKEQQADAQVDKTGQSELDASDQAGSSGKQSIDKVAAAQELVDNLEQPDNGSKEVDLDSL